MTLDEVKATYGAIVQNWAQQLGVPPSAGTLSDYVDVVCGIIFKESQGNPNAVGDGGCSIGLMQLNTCAGTPQSFGYVPGTDNLFDPTTNIGYGCKYLNSLLGQYSLPQAISAYNAGSPTSSNVSSYVNVVVGYARQLGSTLATAFQANPIVFVAIGGAFILGVIYISKTKK